MILKYISGYQALNIPDEKGLIADWHSYKFDPYNIKFTKNNKILQNLGIKKRLIKPINKYHYVASFARAIADMIYLNDNINEFYDCRNDYLSVEDENELWEYLQILKEHKNIEEFLKYEFTKRYFEGKNERISKTKS